MVNPHALGFQFDSNENMSALSNPVVLQKLNAYIGAITNEETKIVEDAISNLRQKLMRVDDIFSADHELFLLGEHETQLGQEAYTPKGLHQLIYHCHIYY